MSEVVLPTAYLFNWLVSFVIFESMFNTFAWTQTNYEKPSFKTLKRYYHDMPVPIVVFGDFFYSTMIFLNALAIHTMLFREGPTRDITGSVSNMTAFVAILIGVQVCYDILYYIFVTRSGLDKRNDYVAFFKEYAEDYSYRAIYSDSIYLALWSIVFYVTYNSDTLLWKYYAIAFGGFLLVMMSYEDM